jgi:aerobic C4-dicarboxylate transport protein
MAVSAALDTQLKRGGPFYTGLFFQVVVAIVVGGLIGYFYRGAPWIEEYFKWLGDLFVKLVKMIIAPVIFLTISLGIANMRDMGKLGRVALKAFAYFIFFSSLALVVGLLVSNFWQTGAGLNVDPAKLNAGDLAKVAAYGQKAEATSLTGFIGDIVPNTLVGAFTSGSILQVVFVAIMFGIGLALAGDRAQRAVDVMTSISDGVFKMVSVIMQAAPIGAMGAFAFVISSLGVSAIANLAELVAAVYLTSFLFIVVVLGVVGLFAGFSVFDLVRYLKEEIFLVIGTSSSESALPALIDKMERAGCARPVVGLVVPIGYSFNLDGTNIYMTLAALFIAQATNIHLSIGDQLFLLGVAMLSSKGAAGVTGAGFIALAATLEQVHSIPLAGMALILGVDRFLSQCRALTNFIGNAIATIVVSRWEGALDMGMLNAAMKGRPAPALAALPVEQDAD